MSSSKEDKTDRVYLRVDPTLKREAQEYCNRHNTTLSALVTAYLRQLLEEEHRSRTVDADQF